MGDLILGEAAGLEERADLLFRAAEVMRRRRWELSAWAVYECAKPWREADADIAEAIDFCDYYGREMIALAKGRQVIAVDLQFPRRTDTPAQAPR